MLIDEEGAACLRLAMRNGPCPVIRGASEASNREAIGKGRDTSRNAYSSCAGHATKLTHFYVASPHDGQQLRNEFGWNSRRLPPCLGR